MKLTVDVEARRPASRWPTPLATGISVASQGLLRLGVSVLIGRLGGPALLGDTASMMATAQIAALLGSSALGAAAAKYVALSRIPDRDHSAARTARTIQVWNVILIIVVTPIAVAIWMVNFENTALDLAVIAALVIGMSLYPVYRGIQLGAGLHWRATAVDVATAAAAVAAVTLIGMAFEPGPAMLIPLGLTYVVYAALSFPTASSDYSRRTSLSARSIAAFTGLTMAGTIGSTGLAQASVITARLGGGEVEAGVYAAAVAVTTPLSMASAAISMAVFPHLVTALGAGNGPIDYRAAFPTIGRVMAASSLIWPPFIIAAPTLARAIWGTEFAGLSETTRVLTLGSGITMAGTIAVSALTAASNRGAAMAAGLSWIGVAAAVSVWTILGGESAHTVAIGYFASTAVIGLFPLAMLYWLAMGGWIWSCVKYILLLVGATFADIIAENELVLRALIISGLLAAGLVLFRSEIELVRRGEAR